MLLKSISLQNIRSYTQVTIPFNEGITLLSGDIGSGKSTILLSIEFALFGLIKSELSGSTLLRKGTTKGFVELALLLNEKEITIRRVLKQTKNGIVQDASYIIIDGVKKEASPVELKSIIFEFCGYPLELLNKKNLIFRYTVYTPQEQMKRIVLVEKEERLNTLRRAFGIDKYKKIRENTSILQKKIREECKNIEGFLSDTEEKQKLFEEYKEQRKVLQQEIMPLEEKKQILTQKKEEIKEILKTERESFEKEQKLLQKLATYDAELKEVIIQREQNNTELASLNKEKEDINLLDKPPFTEEEKEKEIKEKEENLTVLRSKDAAKKEKEILLSQQIEKIEKMLKEEAEFKKRLIEIKKEIGELEKNKGKKEVARSQFDQKSKEKIILEKSIISVTEKKEASLKLIKKMQELRECPFCLQQVSDNHRAQIIQREGQLVTEIEKKEITIKDQQQRLEEAIELAKKEVELYESSETKIQEMVAKSQVLEHQLKETTEKEKEKELCKKELLELKNEQYGDQIKEIEEELHIKKQQLKVVRQYQTQAKVMLEKESTIKVILQKNDILKERVISINKQKIDVQKELPEVSSKVKLQETESQLDLQEQELKGLEIKISTKKTQSQSILVMEKTIEEELQKKNQAKKKLQKKRQYQIWLDKVFLSLMSIIEKNILSSIYHEFNTHFKEWFSMLIDDELLQARLDDEFTPFVQQNGYDTEITALSGGEKTALSLAYRLALNKVINDITAQISTKNLIILDEPTDGFSEQQLDKMRDVLSNLDMKQIILVSHEQKIESYVEHIIRITKEQHVSVAL